MRPLMYQFTEVTCWYVSMINGIMLLRWRRSEDPKHSLLVPMEDRLLRSLTSQYTEFSDSGHKKGYNFEWDTMKEFRYYESVMKCMAAIGDFEAEVYRKGRVKQGIQELDFSREVAICNTQNGTHAILLHGREKGWINCFDPWWPCKEVGYTGKHELVDDDPQTNLRVTEQSLLGGGIMGGRYRFLTILRT